VAFGVHNRPYAWLSFFAILSTLAAVHLSRGERGKWFVIYAAAAILGMYTHYLFVWNLVFQVALVFFYQRHNRRFLARFGLVCLTVAAVFCLWVPTFLAQVRWSSEPGHQSWFYWYSGRPSARDVATSLGRNVMLQLAPGRITGTCGEDAGNQCWLDDALTVVFYSVALSIVALCGWRILRHLRDATHGRATPDPWSLCVLWAGCVFVGPAITDLALESHMVSSHRYFISGSGPVYLATAIAIAGTRHRYLRRGVGLATLLFLLGGSGLYLRGLSGSLMYEINARDVARHVDEQSAGPDDLILVLDPGLSPTDFAYYLRSNPDFARVGVPGRRPAAREVPTQLQRITRAKARGRIWYLDDHGPETRANAAVLEWLRTHFVEVEAREFTNVDLFMFTPRRGSTGGTMGSLK
jgi:hypothetical protein